jgi:hypothetical protein
MFQERNVLFINLHSCELIAIPSLLNKISFLISFVLKFIFRLIFWRTWERVIFLSDLKVIEQFFMLFPFFLI